MLSPFALPELPELAEKRATTELTASEVKTVVIEGLKVSVDDPDSLEVRGISVRDWMVCGWYNVRKPDGIDAGYRRFLYKTFIGWELASLSELSEAEKRGSLHNVRFTIFKEEDDPRTFPAFWNAYCGRKPVRAVPRFSFFA